MFQQDWNIPRNEIHAGRLVILLSIPQTGWQPLQVFFHTFHDIDIRLLQKIMDLIILYLPYNMAHGIWASLYGHDIIKR